MVQTKCHGVLSLVLDELAFSKKLLVLKIVGGSSERIQINVTAIPNQKKKGQSLEEARSWCPLPVHRQAFSSWKVGGWSHKLQYFRCHLQQQSGLYFLHIYRLLVPHGAFLEDDTRTLPICRPLWNSGGTRCRRNSVPDLSWIWCLHAGCTNNLVQAASRQPSSLAALRKQSAAAYCLW
jgi:hypothetical protein